MPNQIKILIIVALGLVALGGVLFYAQPDDHDLMNVTPSGNTLKLTLDPVSYDFGTISMKNGKVTKSFAVKNEQSSEVFLNKLFTSCMCTEAKIIIGGSEYGPFGMESHGVSKTLNKKLAAGESAELQVTFDPNAHGPSGIGVIERSVVLQDGNGDQAVINIKADVIP